jgi:hypothetical protein
VLDRDEVEKGRCALESGYGQKLLLHPFMARSPILYPTRRVLSALEGVKSGALAASKLGITFGTT